MIAVNNFINKIFPIKSKVTEHNSKSHKLNRSQQKQQIRETSQQDTPVLEISNSDFKVKCLLFS